MELGLLGSLGIRRPYIVFIIIFLKRMGNVSYCFVLKLRPKSLPFDRRPYVGDNKFYLNKVTRGNILERHFSLLELLPIPVMAAAEESFNPKLLDQGPLFSDEKVKEKETERKESVEVTSELPGDVYEDIRAIDLGADGKERPIGRSTTVKSDPQRRFILTFYAETDIDVATRLISLEDDPSLPAFTFRLWFLGLGLSCFGAVLGQIFVRTSNITIPHYDTNLNLSVL